MATRRTVAPGKAQSEKIDLMGVDPLTGEKSNIAPAVPAHVIFKLLGFTFAMIVGPIGTYYATLDYVFKGNSTFAGATAAIMANVVLIAYVIVAMREDQSEAIEAAEKEKKSL